VQQRLKEAIPPGDDRWPTILDLRFASAAHDGLAKQSEQATDPELRASARTTTRTYRIAVHDLLADAAPLHPKRADAPVGDGTVVGWVVGIAAREAWGRQASRAGEAVHSSPGPGLPQGCPGRQRPGLLGCRLLAADAVLDEDDTRPFVELPRTFHGLGRQGELAAGGVLGERDGRKGNQVGRNR
jgi:hypothetical protein